MAFLIFVGIISLLFGILILFSPQTLRNLNNQITQAMNKLAISVDEKVYALRIGIGVSSIIVSILAFFVAYFLAKKYG